MERCLAALLSVCVWTGSRGGGMRLFLEFQVFLLPIQSWIPLSLGGRYKNQLLLFVASL